MIRNLHIDGFRGLDGVEIGSLGRVNVIVGPGGSGKTNLLEAVFFFCTAGEPGGMFTALEQRGITAAGRSMPEVAELLGWYISKERAEHDFEIRGDWDGVPRRTRIQRVTPKMRIFGGSSVFNQQANLTAQSIATFEAETRHGEEVVKGILYITPQQTVETRDPVPINAVILARIHGATAHRLSNTSQALAGLWTQVEDRKEEGKVEELLRILEPDIESIRVAAGQSGAYLRVHHRRFGPMPYELLGDGFSKALCLACNLAAAANGVLLLDEFEVSLHTVFLVKMVSFVLEAAKRMNAQLFLSTHSIETVDAFIDLSATEYELHILRLAKPGRPDRIKNVDRERALALREDIGLDLRQT